MHTRMHAHSHACTHTCGDATQEAQAWQRCRPVGWGQTRGCTSANGASSAGLAGCRALMTRPPQDYAPWAAALPYLYKLERLLPCYAGKGLLAGIFLCGCAVSRRVFRCPRKQVNEAKPVLVPSAPGPACRLAALGGRRAAAQLPAPAPAGEQSISAQQPTAASASAPSLLCRGVPVRQAAGVSGHRSTFSQLLPATLQVLGGGSGSNATSSAGASQLLFSFRPDAASVPAAHQTAGYQLLRCGGGGRVGWGCA